MIVLGGGFSPFRRASAVSLIASYMNFGEYETLAWISGLLPSISVLTISFMPAPPNTILMSLRLACSIAFSTPTAMSSSAAQIASTCLDPRRSTSA
jgi:hypothetical protein